MTSSNQEKNKAYQKMIQEEHTHLTQFDVDLIRCIRDNHPILYTKIEGLTGHQRGGLIRKAWYKIRDTFKDLPVQDIKKRWNNICESYKKAKEQFGSDIPKTNKFHDGLLDFLDTEDSNDNVPQTTNSKASRTKANIEAEDRARKLKELIHEEIDISEDEISVKEEVEEEEYENEGLITHHAVDEPIDHDAVKEEYDDDSTNVNDTENDKVAGAKKWTEEELLNATRLTKDMIKALIEIKSTTYYTQPADS